jgi:hypothetical protein
MKVALASCAVLPEPDPDAALLVDALHLVGAEASVLAWDDPAARFDDADVIVLRSTWNYYRDLDAFLAWVERASTKTPMYNPPHIVRWNAEKTYFADLSARGIAVVPTVFAPRREGASLDAALDDNDWDDLVIKPTVSAASFQTKRFGRSERAAARAFFSELAATRDVMVQQYMPDVEGHGERAIVWIDGELTHAVRKSARLAGGDEAVSDAVAVSDEERAFAEGVLAPFASELLYARVDVVRHPAGDLRLMELELLEPSLFLAQRRGTADKLAHAIVKRVRP